MAELTQDVVLEARHLGFCYADGVAVLTDVDLRLGSGDLVAITGKSGVGKSTLLHCLAGILRPTTGRVEASGVDLTALDLASRARFRLSNFGFVMQFGELIPELTLGENIELPLKLLGYKGREARRMTEDRAGRLGIAHLLRRRVWEVSGGEMQRAAVARAVVHGPSVVFADEPTGALDDESEETVLDLILEVAGDGKAVLVVTHDIQVASRCKRSVSLTSGRLDGTPLGTKAT